MITKFTNALIMTSPVEEIISGELVIEDNLIKFIGKQYKGKTDNVIDCKGNLLMAGFINCHTHSSMTLLKGISDSDTLEDWLYKKMNPIENSLTESDIYTGTVLAIAEFLKNGITCFQDCYFMPRNIVKAIKDCGIRAVVGLSQNKTLKDYEAIEDLEKLYLSLKDESELIDYLFYCHSVYTCNETQFFNAIKLAKKYDKMVATHMSETLTEVGLCTQTHGGMTPVMLLESYGFFDVKCLLAHGVHLQKEDYEILKKYNLSIAHNPSSNLKLGSGIANLKSLKNNNINICLGTDGSASNNKLDMFREMYLSSVLQKTLLNDTTLVTSEEALSMATINGAKALNNNKIGSLKKGNFADIIMIDMHSINNKVCNNIKSNLVYACGAEDVLMTMVNGKILYENGKFNVPVINQIISKNCRLLNK